MISELSAEIRVWRDRYFHLGQELGEIINDQQNTILALQRENKRLRK